MTPQTELASKLKDVLSKMTQEEFDKEWSKVTSLNLESPSFGEVSKNITPIELPSDEEIQKEINANIFIENDNDFLEGAKWMRNKIQGGNK